MSEDSKCPSCRLNLMEKGFCYNTECEMYAASGARAEIDRLRDKVEELSADVERARIAAFEEIDRFLVIERPHYPAVLGDAAWEEALDAVRKRLRTLWEEAER